VETIRHRRTRARRHDGRHGGAKGFCFLAGRQVDRTCHPAARTIHESILTKRLTKRLTMRRGSASGVHAVAIEGKPSPKQAACPDCVGHHRTSPARRSQSVPVAGPQRL
jgi:hypothetical protein